MPFGNPNFPFLSLNSTNVLEGVLCTQICIYFIKAVLTDSVMEDDSVLLIQQHKLVFS